jgi:hypothetical protein
LPARAAASGASGVFEYVETVGVICSSARDNAGNTTTNTFHFTATLHPSPTPDAAEPASLLAANWQADPLLIRLVVVGVAVVVLALAVRLTQADELRTLQDSESRYDARKLITFVGYVAGLLVVSSVFRDRFCGLTVSSTSWLRGEPGSSWCNASCWNRPAWSRTWV